jgi:hydrogenase maturation factor
MNEEQREHLEVEHLEVLGREPDTEGLAFCVPDEEGHCLTCSDEALPARVLRVDQATGLALVMLEQTAVEIDTSLIEGFGPGDWVLVHGGVAVASLGEASNGSNRRL